MEINSDTKLYGSFSVKAGNLGCKLFNEAFQYCKINAIYKSFSVSSIKEAVEAARTLNFAAFAVSMPYKIDVLNYVDYVSEECLIIGAANTIIKIDENYPIYKAYNTDIYAADLALKTAIKSGFNKLYVLGNGGYSKAIQYAAKKINLDVIIISRSNWNDRLIIDNSIVYNCTPVENIEKDLLFTNYFIDCVTTTNWGKKLSMWQASKQFEMYSGQKYPFEI